MMITRFHALFLPMVLVCVLAACGGKGNSTSDVGLNDDGSSTPPTTDTETTDGYPECIPECGGKLCGGDDGCGGICPDICEGTCTPENDCVGNTECIPDCSDKMCGFDGCGGGCPDLCDDLICIPETGLCDTGECIPECDGKMCGNDGCGGGCPDLCGELTCIPEEGTCESGVCVPDCEEKMCGDDGCGGGCEDKCGELECQPATGTCGPVECSPNCVDKLCGDDGCGGLCPDLCDGVCIADTGECDTSQQPCVPDCAGKLCGEDGCGAECPDLCDGICVTETGECTPSTTEPTACQSETDQAISATDVIESASILCVWPSYDDWELAGTCFQEATGLSDDCVACFTALFQCAFVTCDDICGGAASPACDTCIGEKCDAAFMECSGVTYEEG
jgi:hypothetical protein